MTLLASTILARVRYTLIDAAGTAWPDAELLSYLNGGMTQIIDLKPDAFPRVATVTLVGGPIQSLPSDGALFLNCIVNHVGEGVTVQPMSEFVRVQPQWTQAAAGNTRYVLIDPRLPKTFYVYPPAVNNDPLQVMYGAIPTRLTAISDSVDLADYYETSLWAFTCALAYAKNTKQQDFSKSDEMMKIFTQSVIGNTPIERATATKPDLRGVM